MLKIGHRGAPGIPRVGENTIGSFKRALWKGADAIEFDVRRSNDGHLVVIHDASVDRTTSGRGLVRDLTSAQLRALDAGFGDFVPKLSHVFDLFGGQCLLHVEIKESDIVWDVVRLIKQYHLQSQVIVSAFATDDNDKDSNSSWDKLDVCRRESIPFALVATPEKIWHLGERYGYGEKHKGFIDEAVMREAFAIHPKLSAVNGLMVDYAHQKGLLVNTWVVNTIDQVEQARRAGVDGVFSDCPEIL